MCGVGICTLSNEVVSKIPDLVDGVADSQTKSCKVIVASLKDELIEERSSNDGCNGEIPMMSPLASSENAKHRIIRTAMLLHARLITLLHFKNKHTGDYNYHPDSLPPA